MDRKTTPYRNDRYIAGRIAIVLAMIFVFATAAQATQRLQDFSAKKHHRFYTGEDKDFIGSAFDSSGVGRVHTNTRWATMISDRFYLSASHWPPLTGEKVRFYNSNDPADGYEEHQSRAGQQIKIDGVGSDLWLGRLFSAPSDSIARYPILDLTDPSAYENLEILTYGLDFGTGATSQRLGRNTIDPHSIRDWTVGGSTGMTYAYDFDTVGGVGPDESFIQGGDSGGPSFVAYGDQLAIVGMHWFKFGNNSADTFVPHFISALNDALEPWGESVMVLSIPEPSSVAILGLALMAYGMKRKAPLTAGAFHDNRREPRQDQVL